MKYFGQLILLLCIIKCSIAQFSELCPQEEPPEYIFNANLDKCSMFQGRCVAAQCPNDPGLVCCVIHNCVFTPGGPPIPKSDCLEPVIPEGSDNPLFTQSLSYSCDQLLPNVKPDVLQDLCNNTDTGLSAGCPEVCSRVSEITQGRCKLGNMAACHLLKSETEVCDGHHWSCYWQRIISSYFWKLYINDVSDSTFVIDLSYTCEDLARNLLDHMLYELCNMDDSVVGLRCPATCQAVTDLSFSQCVKNGKKYCKDNFPKGRWFGK